MNAKGIGEHKFEKCFNGYRPEDVDSYVRTMADNIDKLEQEKHDLEQKLEVLANKVREYREDEEALKEALLSAQRQGSIAISDAKQKAEEIIASAKEKAEEIIAPAEEEKKRLYEEAKHIVSEARIDAERILSDAKIETDKIGQEAREALEVQREILLRTKNETVNFRNRILSMFKEQAEILQNIPDTCETEFIHSAVKAHVNAERVKLQQASDANMPDLSDMQDKPIAEQTPESAQKNLVLQKKPDASAVPSELRLEKESDDTTKSSKSKLKDLFPEVKKQQPENRPDINNLKINLSHTSPIETAKEEKPTELERGKSKAIAFKLDLKQVEPPLPKKQAAEHSDLTTELPFKPIFEEELYDEDDEFFSEPRIERGANDDITLKKQKSGEKKNDDLSKIRFGNQNNIKLSKKK